MTEVAPGPEPAAGIALSDDEAMAVAEAATAYADAVPPGRAAPYRELAAVSVAGHVPDALLDPLQRVCTLALETGKARRIGRAESERLLTAVLRRTPIGRAMTAEVSDVNRAFGELSGRRLETARLRWRMPGRYELDIEVEGFSLTVAIQPEGLEVRHLQSG